MSLYLKLDNKHYYKLAAPQNVPIVSANKCSPKYSMQVSRIKSSFLVSYIDLNIVLFD